MRIMALGAGLALLGSMGIAQAQVPPKPDAGAGGGTPPGRPVLLLPLPHGGYAVAQQTGPTAGTGPAMPGVGGQPQMGMHPQVGMQPMMGGQMGNPAMRADMMRARMRQGWMRHKMQDQGGAIFAFRRGPANIFIRCAADEPMQACVSAASTLIDKVASMGPGGMKQGGGGAMPGSGSGSSSGSGSGTTGSGSSSH